MNDFEDLKKALSPEIEELKTALADKKRADAAGAPAGLSPATQKYLGLQFKLDQTLRKRGLRGPELDVAMKAIMEVINNQ